MKLMLAVATAKQQETAAFKKWFGKSKVVGKDGRPLRVYHGTTQSFRQFDAIHIPKGNNENGIGFYFTDNPEWSKGYAGGEGGNTIPVYLKILKPINYHRQPEATATQIQKLTGAVGLKAFNNFLRNNYGSETPAQVEMHKREYRETMVGMDLLAAADNIYMDLYDGEPKAHMFAEIFKAATGYDGVIIQRHEGTNYVVFTPTQIKSAIGNKGTFKPRTAAIDE